MRISLNEAIISVLLGCFMSSMAHAKLMKCIKKNSPQYEVYVSENEVKKYIRFDYLCTPLDPETISSNWPIKSLQTISLKSEPLTTNPATDQIQKHEILSGIRKIMGDSTLTDKECIRTIKENRGVITADTKSCYNIFRYRYTKNTNALPSKNKISTLSDTFGPIATQTILENRTCSEIRDLNFALIASSSKAMHEKLRNLDVEYSRKLYKKEGQEKVQLSNELASKIEENTLLQAKAVCSLGASSSETGQMNQPKNNMLSDGRLKNNGIYYFSDEIIRQVNTVTSARDIAAGKANDRSHGLDE